MICVDGTLMKTGERSAPVVLKADPHIRTVNTRSSLLRGLQDCIIGLYTNKSADSVKIVITRKVTDIAVTSYK